jgi:hypothetical protein
MRPSDLKSFRELLATIREELASFRKIVDQRSASIANQHITQQETEKNEREKVSHAIDNLSNQQNQSANTAETNQNRRHGQNLLPQWTTAIATLLAFTAAAVYAGIAGRQWTIMHDTYTEIQTQTQAAQQAAFAACVNAQIARRALIQGQNNSLATQTEAIASTEQALVASESERASPDFLITYPNKTPTNQPLSLPYIFKNDGKSDARDIHFTGVGTVVPRGNSPKFSYPSKRTLDIDVDSVKGGAIFPEPPALFTIDIFDQEGSHFKYDQGAVDDIFNNRVSDIVIYGVIKFSDFQGRHWRHVCRRISIFGPGHNQVATSSEGELRCYKYDTEGDYPRLSKLRLPTEQTPPIPEVDCKVPTP